MSNIALQMQILKKKHDHAYACAFMYDANFIYAYAN